MADEIAYQELTITIKDTETDKVTTFTGRVKGLEIVMTSTPAEPDVTGPAPIIFTPTREIIKVHLMGEWVQDHDVHYYMTILDDLEPVKNETIDLNAPMESTLLVLFGKGWQELPYVGEEEKSQILRRIARARIYLNRHRKSTFPIELDFEIGEGDAGVIRLNVRGPKNDLWRSGIDAVPDGRDTSG